ncbi:U4/U6 small nuclear ribonucleoprotein Prp [Trema orientale]|uniref:U4/U6 small nuclear ribonucleoprotein Prp n=1 Tax=Trema orientale TaxID=63057 RepID=A0A2P5DMW8_TREOI|nr:U4/U6 small nuclear ribonucleoprotein Prp [Trema orientale]
MAGGLATSSFLAEVAELSDTEEVDNDGVLAVAELETSTLFNHYDLNGLMQKIDALQNHQRSASDHDQYPLIGDCNELSLEIEREIVTIHNFIRDKYRPRFPELESVVRHPIDYASVVKSIGNGTLDATLLEKVLPKPIVMVVSVLEPSTVGKPLPEEALRETLDACDRVLSLDSAKRKIVEFLDARMGRLAPNLSAVVGSDVAARLVTETADGGGLAGLATMPCCNVLLLGARKKNLAGFSTAATSQFRIGYIEHTEILQATPPSLRVRASRLVASKATLAARVDSAGGDPSGNTGRALREEIRKKIEKWQEPPPAKQAKPLPVPTDSEPGKKRRGGRRLRKMKERYAVTDLRKLANRVQFGVPEETSLGDRIGEGYGMLGQAGGGSGKLRVSVGQNKLAAKVASKFKGRQYGRSSGTATSGLASSLAFTAVQGIELANPQAVHQLGSGTQSTYFSDIGPFCKIKRTL